MDKELEDMLCQPREGAAMELFPTRHAKERMEERGIHWDEIKAVVEKHDTDLPGNPENTRKWIGDGGKGRRIVLFVVPEPTRVVIVSAAVVS